MNGPLAILKSAAPDRNSIEEKLLQMDFFSGTRHNKEFQGCSWSIGTEIILQTFIKMLSNHLQNNKITLVLWGARKEIKLLRDLIMSVTRNPRYWIKSAEKQKENLIQREKGREGFACRNWIFPCNFIFYVNYVN